MSDTGFVRGHQVARVLGVAIPLAMFLVWWGIWGGRAEVAAVSEVAAVVIRDEGKTCLVRIDTGEEVRVIKPRNVREGMAVRMRRTAYDDGKLRFDLITSTAHIQ